MINGALYIRVSTVDQTELSPDAQKRLLLQYAKQHEIGISPEHIYIDAGISGRTADKRPSFMKMIATARCHPPPFEVILVHKFDRFARSREDSVVYKSLLKKDCNIRVLSITESIENDKFSVILEAMLEAMAEYYSLNLSEEVLKGMTENALRGGYQARPPLGYQVTTSGSIPSIVPAEANIVRLIYQKFHHEKMSIFEIAKYLNLLGLKTKLGNNFEKRSVSYILQNPFYLGKLRWNRVNSTTHQTKDPSEWIISEGQHEAIISPKLFDAIQKRFQPGSHTFSSRPGTTYKHWLSGLVRCSSCGRTLTVSCRRDIHNGCTYYNFQCYGYCKGLCSLSHSISAKKLTNAVIEAIQLVIPNPSFRLLKNQSLTDKTLEVDILKEQLCVVEQKFVRIMEAYQNGIDTIEEYRTNKNVLLLEKCTLQEELDKVLPTDSSCSTDEKSGNNSIYISDILMDDNNLISKKSDAIKSIIKEIIYDKPNSTLEITFYLS